MIPLSFTKGFFDFSCVPINTSDDQRDKLCSYDADYKFQKNVLTPGYGLRAGLYIVIIMRLSSLMVKILTT